MVTVMYLSIYFLITFFPILLLLLFLNHRRRKKIIKKICCMCMCDKCTLLNELVEPFGYYYISAQDIFTSRIDAWQRELGYCSLYDNAASHFQMIFDSLPVCFNYQGKTWLMEFWKGQYGINTGGEIGLYYADRIVEKRELKRTLFHSVSDTDMIKMSFRLIRNNTDIAHLSGVHWWLTAFKPGCFSRPADLVLQTGIVFPTGEMANAFVKGLLDAGFSGQDIQQYRNRVSFVFRDSSQHNGFLRKLRIRLAQCANCFWCKVYLFISRPFCLSIDRILFLYYYLPFAFRKTLRIRKHKSHGKKR